MFHGPRAAAMNDAQSSRSGMEHHLLTGLLRLFTKNCTRCQMGIMRAIKDRSLHNEVLTLPRFTALPFNHHHS